jgi:hypothetical protein
MFAASLVAQGMTVDPAVHATIEGNYRNSFPFGQLSMRYQQFHGDLRGAVRNVSAIAFRQRSSARRASSTWSC